MNLSIKDNIDILINPVDIDIETWNNFILTHPDGNIFQTYHFYKIYKASANYRPHLIIAQDKSGIAGVWLSSQQKTGGMIMGFFSSRLITSGGPLVRDNDPEILESMLSAYKMHYKRNVVYSQIRNTFDTTSIRSNIEGRRFKYTPHLNILINLHQNINDLKGKIDKNKRRNLTKSTNKGTRFFELTKKSDILQSLELIIDTYERIKMPIPNKTFFLSSIDELLPSGILQVFGVQFESKLIGVRFELCYNKTIYDWYAGSDNNFRNKYPNDVLLIHILEWGNMNGYHTFDFGGAGSPGKKYGVRDHKKKFGGSLVEFGRYELIHKPFIFRFSKIGFWFWQRVKG